MGVVPLINFLYKPRDQDGTTEFYFAERAFFLFFWVSVLCQVTFYLSHAAAATAKDSKTVKQSKKIMAAHGFAVSVSVYNSDVRDGGINAETIFGCTETGL